MKAFSVTLTSADTNYNIGALIKAIAPTFYDQGRQVMIQSNTANTAPILIGDVNLGTSRYGLELTAALSSVNLGSAPLMVRLQEYYARSTGAAQILNITILY